MNKVVWSVHPTHTNKIQGYVIPRFSTIDGDVHQANFMMVMAIATTMIMRVSWPIHHICNIINLLKILITLSLQINSKCHNATTHLPESKFTELTVTLIYPYYF